MPADNKVMKAKKMGFWMLIALVTGNMIGSVSFCCQHLLLH